MWNSEPTADKKKDSKYSFYSTSGGSMFPAVRWDEQVVVKQVDPEAIGIGDIILFSSTGNSKVAHRVVKKGLKDGKLFFQTKGDHNRELDQPIGAGQIIGKIVVLKRKNNLFAFPPKGAENFKYNLSCFFAFVRHVFRRIAGRIFAFLRFGTWVARR